MRGVSLSINSIIIISLAVLILIVLGYSILTGIIPGLSNMKLIQAYNSGCEIYLRSGNSPDTILVEDINKDGKKETLLVICRTYFANKDMTAEECARKCEEDFSTSSFRKRSLSTKGLGEGCNKNEDCQSGLVCTSIDPACGGGKKCTRGLSSGTSCSKEGCNYDCASGYCERVSPTMGKYRCK